jgi:septin 3/9/12
MLRFIHTHFIILKVNLIPVIAKADALTVEERDAFKQRITADTAQHEIKVFPWTLQEDDAEDERAKAEAKARLPFAVVGACEEINVDGKYLRGRNTRWGFINVDDPEHCEFALLRDALIRVYLCDLKETTAQVHYENYRRQHLSESSAA